MDENFPSLIRTEHSQMIQEGPWTPRNLKKTAPRLTVIKETIPQPERSLFSLREGKVNRRSKNICVFVTLCLKELRGDRNRQSGCWGWVDGGWEEGGKETLPHVSFNLINILIDYIFQKITFKKSPTIDLHKKWKFSNFLSPASVPSPRGCHCAEAAACVLSGLFLLHTHKQACPPAYVVGCHLLLTKMALSFTYHSAASFFF